MEDEYIDIVTQDGSPTGKSTLKSEAHKNGWFHNTAHIWLYTKHGEILLSQRAASKSIFPLLWDVSVAGHVDAGETIEHAAIRETKEEIGLSLIADDLKKIGVTKCVQTYGDVIKDYEFHHAFISELKIPLSSLNIQQEEVEAVKLVSFKTFEELLLDSKSNGHFVATNTAYYTFVLDSIKKYHTFI